MDAKDLIVPQEINIETSARVLTEKQIAVLGIITAVIGGPLALFIPSDLGKIIGLAFGAVLGLLFAKTEIDGMILWDYANLFLSYQREEKVFTMGFLPVREIKDGIIELEDGSSSIMFEITGITYDMMGEGSKAVVLQSLIELLFSINGKISFYALRKKLDISKELREIKSKEEENRVNKEYFASYKRMLVENVREKDIGTMRYFIVLNGQRDMILDEGKRIQEIIDKGGVFRIRRIYGVVSILYEVMNIHRSYYQRLLEEEFYE